MFEKPSFAFEPAGISAQAAIGADHPVAGYGDIDGIKRIGPRHGADGLRGSETRRQTGICHDFARPNGAQGAPFVLLEVSSPGVYGKLGRRIQCAGEIGLQARAGTGGIAALDKLKRPEAGLQRIHHALPMVGELEGAEALAAADRQHFADGGLDAAKQEFHGRFRARVKQ